ncbi:MAG TPA: dimethylsulfoxide reductase subunit B [Peptococcaceae bacterium]|nr:dimethylsulfoxide reductase subunit B [Peptococcaceae bacterium]
MSKKLGFYVDTNSCQGCKTCQITCKDKNDLKIGQLFRQVFEVEGGGYTVSGYGIVPHVYAYYISMSCNHCEEPKCVDVCPTGASYQRADDGLVLINEDRCIGCRLCEWACPYKARQFDGKKMTKCDACHDLLAKGQNPACVDACPCRALDFGPIEELQLKYPGTTKDFKGLPDSSLTKPATLFKAHKNAIQY